jgi:hypothetical protein
MDGLRTRDSKEGDINTGKMKIIVAGMLTCLMAQAAYFAIRDAASATVPAADRLAEVLLASMFVMLILYPRRPRTMLILFAFCAFGIGVNLEFHADDHSLSAILARNLLMIAFLIIGVLGVSRDDDRKIETGLLP